MTISDLFHKVEMIRARASILSLSWPGSWLRAEAAWLADRDAFSPSHTFAGSEPVIRVGELGG